MRKGLLIVGIGAVMAVSGCSVQRAQTAEAAKTQLVGMSRENILSCMGAPTSRATEGRTEVWTYVSAPGTYDSVTTGGSNFAFTKSRARNCTVNVVMSDGRVSRINYLGRTGGLLTAGEQCAYAVEGCMAQ
ncbi:hypothetical protein [Azospirillum sp. TSO35-2]|uniref:hypothetical protein n=1 Tax=Azospirillum sp. TSO35-2 TaxID=716796 RepID=UPI000D606BDA|nr:hypothetical protein [Azospirillum sp. TSO35-2]PWC39271.1 hypothetical protein TSO352_03500 [Azospirillum sp. TSO35-2]